MSTCPEDFYASGRAQASSRFAGVFLSVATIALATPATAAVAEQTTTKSRVASIEWPADDLISASAGSEKLVDVDKTLLPVLVPRSFLAFKSLKFVGQPLQYSAQVQTSDPKSRRAVDLTLSISGTRIAIDDGDAAGGPTTAEITSSVHERTAEATMSRYGAAYVVTVECRRAGDRRCTTGRYAEGLLRSAELVGGTPEDGGSVPTPAILEEPDLIPTSSDPDFRAEPPGNLIARSGQGVSSSTIYAPGILFPVSAKPVYLNSQVWNIGGANGPRGGWSDPRNYRYPWRDNFCEKRPKYKTPACPAGTGHQGVDIRPSKWKNQDNQKAVAVEAGVIVHLGSYMVTLAGDSGTHYNYLHLRNLRVHVGDRVTAGKVIGTISNNFGKTPTTYHLHFEMRQNRNGRGWQHVPPYTSLLAAYERM